MPIFEFQKLVRDNIVGFSIDDPLIYEVKYRVLSDDVEYRTALKEKIFEEAQEIPVRAVSDEEIVEEIADLQTVIDALRESYGISENALKHAQHQKIVKKGDFKKRHFIETVVCDEKSPWVNYFREQPTKYAESDAETR